MRHTSKQASSNRGLGDVKRSRQSNVLFTELCVNEICMSPLDRLYVLDRHLVIYSGTSCVKSYISGVFDPNRSNTMSQLRRFKGAAMKVYNPENCDECDSTVKHGNGSKGSLKSDATSVHRNGDKENLSDERRVLLAITVEIDDGCVEYIHLREGDSAEAVAIKFCQAHALPEQFVAPLTEHIVSSIITLSKEDSDIVFHSQEETLSNDENSTLRGGASVSPTASLVKPRLYAHGPGKSSPLLTRRVFRKVDKPLKSSQASQRVSRLPGGGHCCSPDGGKPKKRRRKKRRQFSDRLLAPTITSLAKCGALDHKQKPRRIRVKPLSEQAKAVCMRLYSEWMGDDHRCKNEAKHQEKSRRKLGLSTKSWRMTRMRGKIAKQYKNYGELLYAEGLTKRQNHLKAVSDRLEQVERWELEELTLKPKISKRAKNMRREQGQIWNRLQTDDRPKQDQLHELRQQVWESKLMECTFRPRINHVRKPDSPQDKDCDYYNNRFEQLFMDAESRRRRRVECMQWYPEGVTFMPAINRGLPYGTAVVMDDWKPEPSVFRRLVDNAIMVMEKKQKKEQLSRRPFDSRTGRELFKPLIGRKPYNRNPVHLPVGEYLHRMKCTFDKKITTLAARDNKMKKEQARSRYVGPNSQRLLERLKDRGFKLVFDYLDSDKDGYVDLTTANIDRDFDRLNLDVIEDLRRLMRMAEGAQKLDVDRFEDLMLKIEMKYHIGHQVHFALKHRRHDYDDKCTFRFKMDRLSRDLAKTRRKYSTHEQWWQIIIAEFLARHQKVEEWRKAKRQQEMAECTFRPHIIPQIGGRYKKVSPGALNELRCNEGETLTDMIEKVSQEVQGFYFQNEQGGPEVMGMRTPGSPGSPGTIGKKGRPASTDRVSELDDLPKANNPMVNSGLFFGLLGA